MTFLSVIETILIGPLKLIYEIISGAARSIGLGPGVSLIALSAAVSLLTLPLYRRADEVQKSARDAEEKIRVGAAHIKKNFSGDEKLMLLQTYYRQNNYRPTDALKGSVSLLLEIPFFIAAYQFISNETTFKGASFGPIHDLGEPDGLLVIGSVAINVLPIIMTLLNIISGAIYTRSFPVKTKVQTYALAAFFLVFLYNAPSCLAFYWALNNLFSLIKNIVLELKKVRISAKHIAVLMTVLLVGYAVYRAVNNLNTFFGGEICAFIAIGAFIITAAVISYIGKRAGKSGRKHEHSAKAFAVYMLFLTLLYGALIPSALIADEPQEYIGSFSNYSPLWYIASTLCLSAGLFLVWIPVFRGIASDSGKELIEKGSLAVCFASMVNYLFFGTGLGIMSSDLVYEKQPRFSAAEQIINIIVLLVLTAAVIFAFRKQKKIFPPVIAAASAAVLCMSVMNTVSSADSISKVSADDGQMPHISLSRGGKNVVVLILDRGIGEFVPYIFNDKPELREQFAGFTDYTDTLSYGTVTNMAMPAVYGGYEYVPAKINARGSETLLEKHNEALSVMPVIFGENGYNVTLTDPVYANYQWIPDCSVFDKYPYITAFNTEGRFNATDDSLEQIEGRKHNFFFHSLMKTSPLIMQSFLYDGGNYLKSGYLANKQNMTDFLSRYNVLRKLPEMTEISSGTENEFLILANNTTHDPITLSGTEFDPMLSENCLTLGDKTLNITDKYSIQHFETNAAVYVCIGKWLDFLRENGVYDNTRIIIAADHGRDLGMLDDNLCEDWEAESKPRSIEAYWPVLMVKDFGSTEFAYSDEFMTNADVPSLALKDLIDDPVNPFTGNRITNDDKSKTQLVNLSYAGNNGEEGDCRFMPSEWAEVNGSAKDRSCWSLTGIFG